METIDEIIERYASSYELPIGEQSTIDTIIELLVGGARYWFEDSWSRGRREDLLKVVNEKPYKGADADTMLLLYDVLDTDSQAGLSYGIQAFESFGREPKKILQLENPDRLVEYVTDTAESLEELVELKNRIIIYGQFGSVEDYRGVSSVTKRLANSLLLVANELAYRLKDVDVRNITEEESRAMESKELVNLNKQWPIRLEAHGAIVMAYEAKGESVVNKEALEALAAYESLAGRYQSVSMYTDFSMGLMEAYARIKYVADKPSTGEVPEELKADYGGARDAFGVNWDQFFRAHIFGVKEPAWKRQERQRAQQQEEYARSGRAQVEDLVDRLLRDPWAVYVKELGLLGLTKEMSYQEARAAFRKGIMAHRSTFVRRDIGTPEYDAAMKKTAAFLDAWNKVEVLYAAKK